ncbi:hypothetical protein F5I97DRAFT_1277053 [Phlebopus sp. FC_14]|nr:hypothetical protein F5I97DRAFT_1277053 [Phlebopus sp. FC_14]
MCWSLLSPYNPQTGAETGFAGTYLYKTSVNSYTFIPAKTNPSRSATHMQAYMKWIYAICTTIFMELNSSLTSVSSSVSYFSLKSGIKTRSCMAATCSSRPDGLSYTLGRVWSAWKSVMIASASCGRLRSMGRLNKVLMSWMRIRTQVGDSGGSNYQEIRCRCLTVHTIFQDAKKRGHGWASERNKQINVNIHFPNGLFNLDVTSLTPST